MLPEDCIDINLAPKHRYPKSRPATAKRYFQAEPALWAAGFWGRSSRTGYAIL